MDDNQMKKTIEIDKVELRVKVIYYFFLLLIALVVFYYAREITQFAKSPRSNAFSLLMTVLIGFPPTYPWP